MRSSSRRSGAVNPLHQGASPVRLVVFDEARERPEVMTARQRMQEEATVAAIEKALTKAPSLTDELRARIIAMLS